MKCHHVQAKFSEYLDGAVGGRDMQSLSSHLGSCAGCRAEFEAWQQVQRALGLAGAAKAPANLGLRLRLAISHEKARRQGHWWDAVSSRWENMLRPALVQASAGLAGALVLIGGLAMLVGMVAVPQPVLANDEPLGAMTSPHYLYAAAHLEPVMMPQDTPIVIEAKVNAAGKVYDFTILSGPHDAATTAQVIDQLMVAVYEPARVFGEPVKGQVLITFSGISVRG